MADIFEEMHAMIGTPAPEPTPAVQTQEQPTNQVIEPPKQEAKPTETVEAPAATTEQQQTVVETPQVESQAIETPVASAPKPEVSVDTDISKLLEEKSGGKLKTVDDLQRFMSDYEKAQEKLNDPYVEYAQKLTEWEESGRPAELFHALQDLETEELSVDDVIKLKLKLDNPEWTREDIELYVEETYKLNPDNNDERTIKFGQLKMQTDASRALDELNELKSKTFVSNNRTEQLKAIEQAENNRKASWQQTVPRLIGEFTQIQIPVDNKGTSYTYNVTPEQRAELQNIMENIVLQAPVNYDEKGIAAFKDVMRKEFINRNFNQIAQSINTFTSSKKNQEKIAEIHNPTGAKMPQQPASVEKKSAEDELFDYVLKQEGLTRGR